MRNNKTIIMLLTIFILILTSMSLAEEQQSSREKINLLYDRLKAIALDDYKPDPADTTLEGGAWFTDFITEACSNWGAVQAVDSPIFLSDNEVSIVFRLEKNAYELTVEVEENGEWGNVKLTNYVPPEDRIEITFAELGADTLSVSELDNLSRLTKVFNADKGKVRLVAILSPT